MSLRKLRIGTRLWVGFSILMALIAAMAAIGGWWLSDVQQLTANINQTDARNQRLALEWAANTQANAVRTVAYLRSSDRSVETLFAPEIKATSAHISVIQKEINSDTVDPKAIEMLKKIGEARQTYLDARKAAFEARSLDAEAAKVVVDKKLMPAIAVYVGLQREFIDLGADRLAHNSTVPVARAALGRNVLAGIALSTLLLAALFVAFLVRSITRPLAEAVSVADDVAKGDLTHEIADGGRDEVGDLGRALNRMVTSLRRTIGEVKEASETINIAATEISGGNEDLSQRTEEQAASLEETAAAMDQLTTTVKQTADNARNASRMADVASQVATKGDHAVAQVVTTMGSITSSSKKVSDITSVIDSIAFQINILSLNAAVEAARAGEHGRGFAVVATEVRTLAHRSATAAKEIKELINNSVETVNAGSVLVESAGKTMGEIIESVRHVSIIMGEITTASMEQSRGIEQVNQAIAQMNNVTQQNASLVEEAAASAASMKNQAAMLDHGIERFRLSAQPADHGSELDHAPHGRTVEPAASMRRAPIAPLRKPRLSLAKTQRAAGTTANADDEEWVSF